MSLGENMLSTPTINTNMPSRYVHSESHLTISKQQRVMNRVFLWNYFDNNKTGLLSLGRFTFKAEYVSLKRERDGIL